MAKPLKRLRIIQAHAITRRAHSPLSYILSHIGDLHHRPRLRVWVLQQVLYSSHQVWALCSCLGSGRRAVAHLEWVRCIHILQASGPNKPPE